MMKNVSRDDNEGDHGDFEKENEDDNDEPLILSRPLLHLASVTGGQVKPEGVIRGKRARKLIQKMTSCVRSLLDQVLDPSLRTICLWRTVRKRRTIVKAMMGKVSDPMRGLVYLQMMTLKMTGLIR